MAGKSNSSGLILPAAIALLLTLAYFALTDGWERLATPLPGVVAIGAGIAGVGAGEWIRRLRRSRQPGRSAA